MRKMLLVPDADGYNSTDGNEVVATALDGGPSHFRRDKIGAPKRVSVKWTMNPVQYQYWRAFYRTGTKKGSLPFLCNLLSEHGTEPTEHQCSFVPGSVTLPSQIGLTYVQQASLEVRPLPTDEVLDGGILTAFEQLGGEQGDETFAQLSSMVNVSAPENIGA